MPQQLVRQMESECWANLECDYTHVEYDKNLFILFLLYTGMRPGEALSLTVRQAQQLVNDGIVTIQSKRGPIRKAIDENVRNLLRNVTATKSMDYRVFGQTIETYRKFFYDMQIELFPQSSTLYHIRKLRNVFAKAIYGISNSIVQVQNSLNHSSPTTTAIYLQQSTEDLIDSYDSKTAMQNYLRK